MRVTALGLVVLGPLAAELVIVLVLAPENVLLVRRLAVGLTPDLRGSKVFGEPLLGESRLELDGKPT